MIASSGGLQQHQHQLTRRRTATGESLVGLIFRSKYGLFFLNLSLVVLIFISHNGSGGDYYDYYGNNEMIEQNYETRNKDSNINNNNVRTSGTSSSSSASVTMKGIQNEDEPCPSTAATSSGVDGEQLQQEKNDAIIGKTSTVMAMATGYGIREYERFVGSLRKTGYVGNIILAVSPKIDEESEQYLLSKDVIVQKVQYVPCKIPVKPELANKALEDIEDPHDRELMTCIKHYPHLKHRWARFPLLRDYLVDHCNQHSEKCGGPVLVTDLADTIFQRNPFGVEAPYLTGLEVYEEFYTIRTTNWLTDWPIYDCKNVHYDEPMLCSGTTAGTYHAILDYLQVMEDEMNVWMKSTKCCCFATNGDDQSIHNYIYYNHQLDSVRGGVRAIPNRMGLIHTVGAQGSLLHEERIFSQTQYRKALNLDENKAWDDPYPLSRGELGAAPETKDGDPPAMILDTQAKEDYENGRRKNWLGMQYGLTDEDGYILNANTATERSFVVHQYDRLGHPYTDWMQHNADKLYN